MVEYSTTGTACQGQCAGRVVTRFLAGTLATSARRLISCACAVGSRFVAWVGDPAPELFVGPILVRLVAISVTEDCVKHWRASGEFARNFGAVVCLDFHGL